MNCNNINNYSYISNNNIFMPKGINNFNYLSNNNHNLLLSLTSKDIYNNLNMINNLNNNTIFNINNINQINNNINIINIKDDSKYNQKNINISNLKPQLNNYILFNTLNKNSRSNIDKEINNEINLNNISLNNHIEKNLNEKNNLINDIFNNNFQNLTENNYINNKSEYISNKVKNFIIENKDLNINKEDLLKYLCSLSVPLSNYLCTKKGTMEIQEILSNSNNESKILFIKLLNKKGLSLIMKNTYGNYFFQKFIKEADKNIIELIISYISNYFIEISKDDCGTFSIQALLNEISSKKEEEEILNYIENHEIEMAYDKNATYVLQKIILLFPDMCRTNLNDIILNNFKELCLDSNGICIIKNFIKTNTLIKDKIRMKNEIEKNFIILTESPYGNYGIQLILDIWEEKDLKIIKKIIMKNFLKLSIQQYSSNVVEKALDKFSNQSKELLIRLICFNNNILIIIKNKYGRFVLNKAINYMNKNLKKEFEIYLINNINNNIYNNKDKNKIRKFMMKIFYNNCQD